MYGLLALISKLFPPQSDDATDLWPAMIYNLALLGWFLVSAGVLYLVIRDQRRRCRACLRRLIMPVQTGSWSRMLQFGRPRIEYICPYGHGTLREEELQILGREVPQWEDQPEDPWEALCAASKESGREP